MPNCPCTIIMVCWKDLNIQPSQFQVNLFSKDNFDWKCTILPLKEHLQVLILETIWQNNFQMSYVPHKKKNLSTKFSLSTMTS
jgi:hypothetical protein